jgi:broad specificity phosphatase PhoE
MTVMKALILATAILISCQPLLAQKAVILVRHAERLDTSTDSVLSAKGEERAARLARQLKDSGVTAIYTTQFQRTIKTAEPIGKVIGVTPVVVPSTEQAKLIERLKTQHANDVVLIVGHSNSIPALLKDLGVKQDITIADDQYDDLFVFNPGTGAVVRLHLDH